jgi:hypothetical protein
MEDALYLCKKIKPMNVRNRRVYHIVLLWELSLLVKGILPTSQGFQKWGNDLLQNSSIQVNWMSTLPLVRKPLILEAGGSSTMFPCENWINFQKEYYLLLRVFNMRNITFVPDSCIQLNGSTVFLVRKQSMLEAEGSSTSFSCANSVTLLKEYLRSESISKWENHSFMESTCFRGNGETHVSYGTIQCVLHTVSL